MIGSFIQRLLSPTVWSLRISIFLPQLLSQPWFYFVTYTLLFSLNCVWNWDAFQQENHNLLTKQTGNKSIIPFWQLYPFQIFSIYFLAFSFISFSCIVFFLLSYPFRYQWQKQMVSIVTISFRSFFMFFCILFLGNKILGAFNSNHDYGMILFAFWMILLSLFVQYYSRLVSMQLSNAKLSDRLRFTILGYFMPLSFLLMVLVLWK
ncbi:hypothetical protein EHQ46_00780 [Leptospira yanagawae]|uniref:DUF4271 domain-containing protein n=1 Tax=Leptospira yanagawae TaxID=293069 RepID=A0ABY2M612_9LEPT|nr:hypothetical protein [Leptospira yanagawae]TGL25523.1 hypothetical protein EHQ46_00780 [Leptospira yanagawae]